ncbi:MAG: peptide deformylase [Candidatus Omnitrophica bacterium]|nr:MAG: Peptide deformylase [Candidatus Hinthialibacteria bacterium OLB16]MBE7487582.1 peptide deformylase [bacterium]MBV6482922.1 Peptide deformylase [bacterium]MCE7908914.1 peptide deformylase [Candidatus Omnitrophica bacterium COP1]MCL4735547.1 peptide deformylase [Candidatus Omnitrophota bacterium]
MKKLRLRFLGEEVLRKKARRIEKITPSTRETVEAMWEVMYDSNGIGLAAPQVGLSQRIILADTREPGEKIALINPEITWVSEEHSGMREGCLSIPGVEGEVFRPEKIRATARTLDGKQVDLEAEGLFARVLQHEIDHLNGILFIDRVSPAELERLQGALARFEKCAAV